MLSNEFIRIKVDTAKMKRMMRAFDEFPSILQEELTAAVQRVVLVIESVAKKNCPVDTDTLRPSITPVVKSWAEAYVGTNMEYAAFVEYGARNTTAQPYLQPAYEEGKRRAPKIFDSAVKRALARFNRTAA